MYDKVTFRIDKVNEPNLSNLETQESRLDKNGNLNFVRYKIKDVENFSVKEYCNGYSIIGSLPKLLFGDNVSMLDRHSTKEAIEKLSDCLLYDMAGAEVSALEFGINTFMRKPPKVYFSMLGDLEGKQTFTRSQRGSTLYYLPNSKRGEKSLCFYDKASEHGSMAGANLLRYELRLQNGYKRLPSILGVPTLTASTLSDRSVYCAILHLWQHMYYSINKLNQLNLKEDSMNSVKTVKDGVKLYRAIMYDEKSIDAFITLLKDNGVFKGTKRGYYNKVREQLLKDVHDVTAPSDEDIKELNTVILNAGAYA